ncbi:MAG: sensory histidine kinase AtoS [Elusimicrobia bacterium ADurb.Bin231]|nr:MAG: sensory histidine kinase AtoS [Elusimicrobia bacterium ADurb.Bin231]
MKIKDYIKKATQTMYSRFVIFTVIMATLLLVSFYVFQLFPTQKKLLRDKLWDRGKTISELSKPIILKALQTKDDITLLSQIENIMKMDDINTAYILNTEGKVIVHNKSGEWDKIFKDAVHQKGLKATGATISAIREPSGYLYSFPLTSPDGTRYILFIGLSDQKLKIDYSSLLQNGIYTAIPTFFIIIILFAIFASYEIAMPISKFNRVLNSILLGKGDEKIVTSKKDEIGQIACGINCIIDKFSSDISTVKNKISSIKEKSVCLICELSKLFPEGLIITDSEDKIIFINEAGASAISVNQTESIDKHILELTKNADFMELVQQSLSSQNKIIKKTIRSIDKTVQILTLSKENEPIGSIIVFS